MASGNQEKWLFLVCLNDHDCVLHFQVVIVDVISLGECVCQDVNGKLVEGFSLLVHVLLSLHGL